MRELTFYNTLTGRQQRFESFVDGRVTMYVCGPTVYGPIHVGNARPAVIFDVLYRLLKRRYDKVCYARNITDIDDKIIQAAAANAESPAELANRWRVHYQGGMQKLGVLPPTHEPLATAYIPQMVALIERLIEKNVAYVADGHVLFHVPSFGEYGELSNRRREEMVDGARVEVAPYKRDAADFVLWKPAAADVPGWESPWGRGRPGWHIECSAMAAACLAPEIDIHGGGQDLIFPHHENESAQSRCAHGTAHFARYWLHNGHVNLDGEKMSKSLNNVRLLQDALARYPGEVVRLALMTTHYRRPLNWNESLLEEAKTTLNKWYRAMDGAVDDAVAVLPAVEDALADDLNTPAAIAALHAAAAAVSSADNATAAAKRRGELRASALVLGVLAYSTVDWFHSSSAAALPEDDIQRLIAKRTAARQARDFAAADALRDELLEHGVLLEDTAEGTTWRLK